MDISISDLLFSESGFLGLNNDFATNLVAGLMIFALEVALVVLLLPIVLRRFEDRKWRSTRRMMGKQLFALNQRLDVWWIDFQTGALASESYQDGVKTPRIFREFDKLIERFSFAMNPAIAGSFTDYRLAIADIESMYRRLCIVYGGNRVGDIVNYSDDFVNRRSPSFAAIRATFLRLLRELDYKPQEPHWWGPVQFQEATPSNVDMIKVRQDQADFIVSEMPA